MSWCHNGIEGMKLSFDDDALFATDAPSLSQASLFGSTRKSTTRDQSLCYIIT